MNRHLSATLVMAFTTATMVSGCSTANQAGSSGNSNSTNAVPQHTSSAKLQKPPARHSFDASKDWVQPNSSPYASGLSTVATAKVPSAFEQSVRPQKGVAEIVVSRGAGTINDSNSYEQGWTQEIQYNTDSFKINGETYTVPKKCRRKQILVLPIDHGIVWAPISKMPDNMNQVGQVLKGVTDIFYTPYQSSGGSLATDERHIAQLPHRWMGLDGPVVASAWSGWLPKNHVVMAHVKSDTTYHLEFTKSSQLKSAVPVNGLVSGWPTLFMRNLTKSAYYQKPHYATFIGNLTRTYGGFVLAVNFLDATQSGRNAGMSCATYYWSEQTGKWTPLAQNFTVQTLAAWTQTGSDGVYWIQPSPMGNGSGNELDVTEMHFDPATLSIQSVWLGNWLYGPSLVDANSWVATLPQDMPTSASGKPKKWTVYTP